MSEVEGVSSSEPPLNWEVEVKCEDAEEAKPCWRLRWRTYKATPRAAMKTALTPPAVAAALLFPPWWGAGDDAGVGNHGPGVGKAGVGVGAGAGVGKAGVGVGAAGVGAAGVGAVGVGAAGVGVAGVGGGVGFLGAGVGGGVGGGVGPVAVHLRAAGGMTLISLPCICTEEPEKPEGQPKVTLLLLLLRAMSFLAG